MLRRFVEAAGLAGGWDLWVADSGVGFRDGTEQHPAGRDEAHGEERVAEQYVRYGEPDDLAGGPEVAEHDDADAVLSNPEPGCSVVGAQDYRVFTPGCFGSEDRTEHDPEERPADHDGGHPREHRGGVGEEPEQEEVDGVAGVDRDGGRGYDGEEPEDDGGQFAPLVEREARDDEPGEGCRCAADDDVVVAQHPCDHEHDGRDGRFDRRARAAEQLHEGLGLGVCLRRSVLRPVVLGALMWCGHKR